MRSIFASAVLGAIVVAAGAMPAAAAWSCQGAAYVCGSPKAAPAGYAKSGYSKASYRGGNSHSRYAARPAHTRSHNSGSVAYSGGGSGFSAGGGIASYYASGSMTASGARFNPDGLTAAHRTLPFGTRVRVTNRSTGASVVVTINDRGPFVGGRVIDLSRGAARAIGMGGLAPVSLEVLGRG